MKTFFLFAVITFFVSGSSYQFAQHNNLQQNLNTESKKIKIQSVIFDDIEKGKFNAVSSIISLTEILTLPKRKNNIILVRDYKETLSNYPNFEFINVDWEIADFASGIRAKYNFGTPDSIQIATAICTGASYFLTADKNFKKMKEIKIKLLQETK